MSEPIQAGNEPEAEWHQVTIIPLRAPTRGPIEAVTCQCCGHGRYTGDLRLAIHRWGHPSRARGETLFVRRVIFCRDSKECVFMAVAERNWREAG